VRSYRADLRRFLDFASHEPACTLDDVTPPTIERWMASMRHLSDATVRRALNALSSLLRWAVRFGYASRNPLDQVERPRKKSRIAPCPRPDEIAAMLDAVRASSERAALLAMATSGLRRAELLALDWTDIDLRAQRLRIHGRGDKQREVLIFQELLAALYTLHAEQHFPTDGPAFRGQRGRRLQLARIMQEDR
jgi:integrase/recombinase XerC